MVDSMLLRDPRLSEPTTGTANIDFVLAMHAAGHEVALQRRSTCPMLLHLVEVPKEVVTRVLG